MILDIKNISKTFQRGGRSLAAVDNVSLSVPEHSFIQIIGRSGSGKTTVLNLITGLLRPDQGEIYFDDRLISELSSEDYARLRNEEIAYVPQRTVLLPTLDVLDNIILPHDFYQRDGDREGRAYHRLEQLGIRDLATAYPDELSGGELRRVQIARALMTSPRLLLADEPTADLDLETSEEIMKLFQSLQKEGMTLILVTHELESLKYGQGVYTMQDGHLLEGQHIGQENRSCAV